MSKVMKIILAALLLVSCGGAQASFTLTMATSASCPYGSALPDGCSGASVGTPQYPNLLDTSQVTALSVLRGSGYTSGTYTWTTTGGGGTGATGTVTVAGGYLGGPTGSSYTIANQGTGYTSRPTISVPAGAGAGTGGSITPTVYQATPHNASTPWNMPGVDYYVGIPPGTVLKDPTVGGNLPTGATYSGGTVTVTGCNVTLDSLDFSLHNTDLNINVTGSNCTTTVQNSKQAAMSTTITYNPIAALNTLGAGGTFIYQHNEYDGLAPYGVNGGSGLNVNNPIQDGTLTEVHNVALYYNYFHNFDAKIIQSSGSSVGTDTLTEKYNLFANFGSCGNSCSHGEAEYTYSGSASVISVVEEFNTYLLQFYYNGDTTTSNLTAPHANIASILTVNGVADDHNVVFAQGPQQTCYQYNPIPYVAAAAIFDGAHSSGGTMNNMNFDHTYIDNSGTYFPWYHNTNTGGGGLTNVTWTNNVDAGTGGACN